MSKGHSIKYYNSAGKLASINLTEGQKWADKKTSNKYVNDIFNMADDGDGIVSHYEINYIKIKLSDKNKNGIFEQQELESGLDAIQNKPEGDVLAKKLKDDICAKTKYGLPTTGEYLGAHLKDVIAFNIVDVLSEYRDIGKESLFSAIITERGLDINERVRYCKNLFYSLSLVASGWGVDKKQIEDYKKEFNAELEKQKNSKLPADGKKLTEITDRLISEILKKSSFLATENLPPLLNSDICEKQVKIIPTTGKQFKEHVFMITKDNVEEVLMNYRNNYNISLDDAIKNEIGLSKTTKDELLAHINKCLNEAYGYKSVIKDRESQIKSDYYTGGKYIYNQNGDNITITNKTTGEIKKFNLENLCKDLPLECKVKFKAMIQKLPAELIIDIFKEDRIYAASIDDGRSFYYSVRDFLLIHEGSITANTLAHETGHALDYMLYWKENKSSTIRSSEFMSAYRNEMQAYIEAGNTKHEEVLDAKIGQYKVISGDLSNYATWNEQEMFAECYALLMTGNCDSKDCILTYFPKTLDAAKKHLEYIRSQNDETRRK